MAETKVSEPKLEAGERVRKVSRNRKSYGEIRAYPEGPVIYWTKRRTDEFHRQANAWMLECDTISAVKLYGVTHVGLLIEDGTKALIDIAAMSPAGIERGVLRQRSNSYVDPRGVRGAMVWLVPDALWAKKYPPSDERHQAMLRQMRVGRSAK